MPPRSLPLRLAVVIVLALCAPLPNIWADWIRLRDGAQIHGKIIQLTDREVTLRSKRGSVTFDRRRVAEIHRVEVAHPRERKREEKKERDSGVVVQRTMRDAPAKSTARPPLRVDLQECTITLPGSFTQERGRTTFPGYKGTLLGLFREAGTDALASVSRTVELPGGASDLGQFRAILLAHYRKQEGVVVHRLARGKIAGCKALVGDFTSPGDSGEVRNLQAWVIADDESVLSLSVSVLERTFLIDRQRYWRIVDGLQLPTPVKGKGSSPARRRTGAKSR